MSENHGAGALDSIIHGVAASALTFVVLPDFLLHLGSSVFIACVSAVAVHFIKKLWLERKKPAQSG